MKESKFTVNLDSSKEIQCVFALQLPFYIYNISYFSTLRFLSSEANSEVVLASTVCRQVGTST